MITLSCQHCGRSFTAHNHRAGKAKYCGYACYRAAPAPIRQLEKERFWKNVTKSSGCWNWARPTMHGYGIFHVGGRKGFSISAHRYSYQELVGPIPDGLELDHLCRNRACVNPDHLEPVTRKENNLRGISPSAIQAAQTECVHGHPLGGNNLYITPKGKRQCKMCRKARLRTLQQRGYFREYSRARRSGANSVSAK